MAKKDFFSKNKKAIILTLVLLSILLISFVLYFIHGKTIQLSNNAETVYTSQDKLNPDVIIVRMDGGICSQMKQYMIGRYFEEKGCKVKYDLEWYETSGMDCDGKYVRNFEILKAFPYINMEVATKDECRYYRDLNMVNGGDPRVISGSAYLGNYYDMSFYINSETISSNFKVDREILNNASKEVYDQIIKRPNSVAIHVRRGDMAKWPIKTEFFINAINYIRTKHSDAHFYFFSDEIEFVKTDIIPKLSSDIKIKVVDINKSDAGYMDLLLIAACQHQICSQGTAGKYGAYMNLNKDKIVIVPTNGIRTIEGSLKDFIVIEDNGAIVKKIGEELQNK